MYIEGTISESARTAFSHRGALTGEDILYDAGSNVQESSNACGPGVMATHALITRGEN